MKTASQQVEVMSIYLFFIVTLTKYMTHNLMSDHGMTPKIGPSSDNIGVIFSNFLEHIL